MVKVIVLPLAKEDLRRICQYLAMKTYSFGSGRKLRKGIQDAANRLASFPKSGMKEPMLEGEDIEYRYLVIQKHYKIIYYLKNETCYISSIWDCRNNPELLKNRFSK